MTEESKKQTDLNIRLLKKFVALEHRKSVLKAALDRATAEIESIREIATDSMIDSGISNMQLDGRTIYIAHEVWAKRLGTIEEAEAALKEAGLEIFLNKGFNHQSLSAFVREKVNNKEPLPDSFKDIICANHVNKIKSVKS